VKFRTGLDRFSKYSAKLVPETIAARFTQVREVALDRAQEAMIKFATIQELVRPILDKHGVSGPDRAKYLAFANKLARHMERVTGPAGTKVAEGLKAYFVSAYAADPKVIDEIIEIVAGAVAGY